MANFQAFKYIQESIKQQGPWPFQRFMDFALYDPEYGYYQNHLPMAGQDFVTSPEFGPWLARFCQIFYQQLDSDAAIVEIGPGTGRLAYELIKAAQPRRYIMVERSVKVRELQYQWLKAHLPDQHFRCIEWLKVPPKESYHGLVIANEIFDAQPVTRFSYENGQLWSWYVGVEHQALVWEKQKITTGRLYDWFNQLDHTKWPDSYMSEVCLDLDQRWQSITQGLASGVMCILDYGYPQHEYYHPDRYAGTLVAYQKNQASEQLLAQPGKQDLSCHVNFTQLSQVGRQSGFQTLGYTSQGNAFCALALQYPFLLSSSNAIDDKQAIKMLMHPTGMGEAFKVLLLTKQMDQLKKPFGRFDRSITLGN
jgi:SAM-dependent MidA family methyltransferase